MRFFFFFFWHLVLAWQITGLAGLGTRFRGRWLGVSGVSTSNQRFLERLISATSEARWIAYKKHNRLSECDYSIFCTTVDLGKDLHKD